MPKKKKARHEFESVLKTFENLILTGQFRPGQRLVEAELIERLDASRYWIRDCLKILAEKGLVKIISYKGAIVADLGPKEIEEIFGIRVCLERLAIHEAVERLTAAHLKQLREMADRFEAASRSNDIPGMIQHNTDFHDAIFAAAGNPTLLQLIIDMRTRMHIMRYAAWSSSEVLEKILEEHQQIVTALRKKDLATLDVLAERHISYSKNFYLARLKTISTIIRGA